MENKFDITKLAQDWENQQGLKYRSYTSYDEYKAHQADKLSKINLEEYNVNFREALRERLNSLNLITPGTNVLCLAARRGAECQAFIDLGCFAVGVDLNPGQDNQYVVVGDFHNLQFADHSVDYVFTNSLDHAFNLPRILSEVQRVLKQGGCLIAELMPPGFQPGAYESCRWESLEDITDTIKSAGFELITQTNFRYPWRGIQTVWRKLNISVEKQVVHTENQQNKSDTSFELTTSIKNSNFLLLWPIVTNKLKNQSLKIYRSGQVEILKRIFNHFGSNSSIEYFNESDFTTSQPQIDLDSTFVIARVPHRIEKTLTGEALDRYRRFMLGTKELYLLHLGSPTELEPTPIEQEIYAHAKHLFCWCGAYWFNGLGLGSVSELMKGRISRLQPAIAADLIPYRPHFKVGSPSFLHISDLALTRSPYLMLASLPQNSITYIASDRFAKPSGQVSLKGKNRERERVSLDLTYTPTNQLKVNQFETIEAHVEINSMNFRRDFLSLGYVDSSNVELSNLIYDKINYYIHAGTDEQGTILEACARGLLPCVSVESGLNSPSALYLTRDPIANQTLLSSLADITEKEYSVRVSELRQWIIDQHNWSLTLSQIEQVILA